VTAAIRRLGAMMAAATRSRRTVLVAEASTALGAIEQDLKLAEYEPAAVRRGNAWLDSRQRTAHAIAGLMAPLWVRANQDPSLGGELSGRLSELADNFEGATSTDQGCGHRIVRP